MKPDERLIEADSALSLLWYRHVDKNRVPAELAMRVEKALAWIRKLSALPRADDADEVGRARERWSIAASRMIANAAAGGWAWPVAMRDEYVHATRHLDSLLAAERAREERR